MLFFIYGLLKLGMELLGLRVGTWSDLVDKPNGFPEWLK